MKKKLVAALATALTFSVIAPGHGQMSSTNYTITTSVLSGGGASMTSDNYKINFTAGQPSPLSLTGDLPFSASYHLYPGFWYTLDVAVYRCWWDIEPEFGDGDVDGSDLVEYTAGNIVDLEGFASEFGRIDCLD